MVIIVASIDTDAANLWNVPRETGSINIIYVGYQGFKRIKWLTYL
jgi:hypothetical protein